MLPSLGSNCVEKEAVLSAAADVRYTLVCRVLPNTQLLSGVLRVF